MALVLVSFLNTVIYRQSWKKASRGRSKCEHCHKKLSPLDLIPIISYLVSKGRCRQCRKKISPFHLYSEIAFILLATILFLKLYNLPTPTFAPFFKISLWMQPWPLSLSLTDFAYYMAVFLGLYFLAIWDALFMEIPTLEMVILIGISAIFRIINQQAIFLGYGFVFCIILYGVVYLTSRLLKKRVDQTFGLGDIFFFFWMTLIVGPYYFFPTLALACFLGIAFYVLRTVTTRRDKKSEKTKTSKTLPFIPFLSLATYLSLLIWVL